ncbi:hypothetical protein AB0910_28075 [Streptomyces sp. NPDC047002]|uniref:hypothetical protein n=1 Tax=Streptomyces sp. NPDC047002 TaxID=3155475 RepID=UPI003455DE38
MLGDAVGAAPIASRLPRWVRPAVFVSIPVLAALVAGAWLSGVFGTSDPFDDDRACAGSDVPLQVALDQAGIRLPPDATDVHYITHASPQPGQHALAVVFHSSQQKMEALLTQDGLVHGGLDDLTDGRFVTGDPNDPVDLCGPLPQAPVAKITGQPSAGGQLGSQLAVDIELSDLRMIRSRATVLITSMPGT